jgi:molybdate transport repressor ModE-like protein
VGGAKLDWDRLKVFQTVADSGSINAAAKVLGRSYGKVSKDLEELERALGHQLFERSNRGLELTTVGEDILRTARSMADSVQTIIDRANDSAPDQLVICAREGIATYWLARRLPELLQIEPDVRLFIKVLPTTPNLSEGDGDIAIQFEKPTAANIVSRQLGWLHYILYARTARRTSSDGGSAGTQMPEAVGRSVPAGRLATGRGGLGRYPSPHDGNGCWHCSHGSMRGRGGHCRSAQLRLPV